MEYFYPSLPSPHFFSFSFLLSLHSALAIIHFPLPTFQHESDRRLLAWHYHPRPNSSQSQSHKSRSPTFLDCMKFDNLRILKILKWEMFGRVVGLKCAYREADDWLPIICLLAPYHFHELAEGTCERAKISYSNKLMITILSSSHPSKFSQLYLQRAYFPFKSSYYYYYYLLTGWGIRDRTKQPLFKLSSHILNLAA